MSANVLQGRLVSRSLGSNQDSNKGNRRFDCCSTSHLFRENEVSDSESTNTSSPPLGPKQTSCLFGGDFIRLDEEDELHRMIERRFLTDLARFGVSTRVEAIHRNAISSWNWQAKQKCFQIFMRAHEEKGKGNANLKQGWFSGSKNGINEILSHGFSETAGNGIHGRGVYLSPLDFPLESLQSSVVDEDGLRHLVLCRVIMGRMELVRPGSEQCHPSSEDYDSGVDDLLCPKKYIVWSSHMNTHIFPDFVISFRGPPNPIRKRMVSILQKQPRSPWMPFQALIAALSNMLPENSVGIIQKYHSYLKEKKITREEVIKRIRVIAGDELLVAAIKSYRDKMCASRDRPVNRCPNERVDPHGGDSSSLKKDCITDP